MASGTTTFVVISAGIVPCQVIRFYHTPFEMPTRTWNVKCELRHVEKQVHMWKFFDRHTIMEKNPNPYRSLPSIFCILYGRELAANTTLTVFFILLGLSISLIHYIFYWWENTAYCLFYNWVFSSSCPVSYDTASNLFYIDEKNEKHLVFYHWVCISGCELHFPCSVSAP